jgi:hypothetical protein
MDHRRPRYCGRPGTFPEYLRDIVAGTLGGQIRSPAKFSSPAWTRKGRLWSWCLERTLHLLSGVQDWVCHTLGFLIEHCHDVLDTSPVCLQ